MLSVIVSDATLKQLIKGGETNTVELKAAAPRLVEMGNAYVVWRTPRRG
jgi:hypothetical protein